MKPRWFFVGFVLAALVWMGHASSSTTYTPPGPLWHIERQTYRCAGERTYVLCHSSPRLNDSGTYRVQLDGRRLWVSFNGTLIYSCAVRAAPALCRTYP